MASETTQHVAMTLADHLPVLQVLVPFRCRTADRSVRKPKAGMAAGLRRQCGRLRDFSAAAATGDRRKRAFPIISAAGRRRWASNTGSMRPTRSCCCWSPASARWSCPMPDESVGTRDTAASSHAVLRLLPAVPDRPSGGGGNGRRVQRLRLPRNFVAVDLCADRARLLRDKRALTAAYDYLIMGTIGATFFVIGLGLLYMATGTLNMADIADADRRSGRQPHGARGLCLHRRRHRSEGGDLSAASLAAERLHLCALGRDRIPGRNRNQGRDLCACCGSCSRSSSRPSCSKSTRWNSSSCPSLSSRCSPPPSSRSFQTDLKRMLAYSSIAQIGYILLGIALLDRKPA